LSKRQVFYQWGTYHSHQSCFCLAVESSGAETSLITEQLLQKPNTFIKKMSCSTAVFLLLKPTYCQQTRG